jgi:hypothetical protein
VLTFRLRADVGLLGDAQIFWLVAGSNEFTTSLAIGEHSRRYSVNRTALKSRLGRLQWHDVGVVVWILPQIGRVLSNRHKVFESTASASVASILRKTAKDGARSADANMSGIMRLAADERPSLDSTPVAGLPVRVLRFKHKPWLDYKVHCGFILTQTLMEWYSPELKNSM